jgi:hypothetical protein
MISQSWDTRVAASHTIECIMKNLPPSYIISTGSCNISITLILCHLFERNLCLVALDPDNCALLEDFDLESILSTGAKLLGADTEKYDVKEYLSGSCKQLTLINY